METNKKQWLGLLIVPAELLIGDFLFPLIHLDRDPKLALLASTVLF